jgi:hypothetical protein
MGHFALFNTGNNVLSSGKSLIFRLDNTVFMVGLDQFSRLLEIPWVVSGFQVSEVDQQHAISSAS